MVSITDVAGGNLYLSTAGRNWATAHALTSSDTSRQTTSSGLVQVNPGGDTYIYRGVYIFDTSSVPAGSTVTSLILQVYAAGKYTAPVGAKSDLVVCYNVAHPSSLAVGEFDWSYYDGKAAGAKAWIDITAGVYNDISLDVAAMNCGGTTTYALLSYADYINASTTDDGNYYGIGIQGPVAANPPKLVVLYTPKKSGNNAFAVRGSRAW